ncbi:MAG: deoxyribose-phosphate aldolase [Spiroplasma sp.]|nr:deoxyribose-phosphate aldolase [Spiroplasma sp.]
MINNLNQYIDQTILKPDAAVTEIETLIDQAKTYQFKAVCINPYYVKHCTQKLKNTGVKICTVIGFPLGANTTATKVFETQTAIADGANEIDVVINIAALKNQQDSYLLEELKQIRQVCTKDIILKVIIETALLTEPQKILACKLVSQAQADFIKTSTGFAGGGATVADIKLLKKNIAKNVAIKASGGIRTQAQAIAMIDAGATRIGTSNGVNIVNNQQSKTSGSY